MVFTDRERRRVAERLRGAAEGDVTVTRAVMGDLGEFSGEDVALRLADMVEPEEPPCNLQTLYEAVFRRPTRRWECIDDAEVEELLDALLRLCNSPARELLARREPADGLSCGDSGDVTTMSAYDLLGDEDRDALRWVREHGGIGQVRLHHALGDGLSDLVDRVAARLGVTVEGLDAQDAEPVLMGAIDRRIMPNGFSWPTGADGEDILPGQVVYANGMPTGDGQEWTVVSVSFGDDHPIHCRDRGGRKRDLKPGWVTHRRAESWELIAFEARMLPQDYVRERGLACGSQYDDARRRMCDDLVRRARALAERDA